MCWRYCFKASVPSQTVSQLLEIIKICQTVSRKVLVLELLDNAHGQSNSWALLSEKSVMKLIFGRGGEACMGIHIVLRL